MSLIKTLYKRNVIFTLVIAGLLAGLLLMPDLYVSPYARAEERYMGHVVEIDNGHLEKHGLINVGSQRLTVKLSQGPYAGREVLAGNDLLGRLESDKIFRRGDPVYVILTSSGDEILAATAYDHYRLPTESLLILVFALIFIWFTGWGGVRALLSFAFAIVVLWKILLPGILRGGDPIWLALGIVSLISGVTLFLVAGVTRTALVAWLGSLLGIVLTALLAFVLFPYFRLHGAIQPFSETLLYSGFAELDLGRLFIAAIFVGASGAVIDEAIDVAAAMREVVEKRPDLSIKELTASGFSVGKAMVSTMVTTLLMAYMSGSMALLMVLLSKGIPPVQLLNINFIAAEILKTVVGSFGLVTVAPFTALVGGVLYVKWQPSRAGAQQRGFVTMPPATLQED